MLLGTPSSCQDQEYLLSSLAETMQALYSCGCWGFGDTVNSTEQSNFLVTAKLTTWYLRAFLSFPGFSFARITSKLSFEKERGYLYFFKRLFYKIHVRSGH